MVERNKFSFKDNLVQCQHIFLVSSLRNQGSGDIAYCIRAIVNWVVLPLVQRILNYLPVEIFWVFYVDFFGRIIAFDSV